LILSVGCGGNKRYPHCSLGDVNIDLEFPIVEIRNFIRADAHFLPFRRKIFSEVKAIHVAEHLDNPLEKLQEYVMEKYLSLFHISRLGVHMQTRRINGLSLEVDFVKLLGL